MRKLPDLPDRGLAFRARSSYDARLLRLRRSRTPGVWKQDEMLRIRKNALEQIHAHMEETYPHECCGLIIGLIQDGVRVGVGARRCGNLNTQRAADRYELDPRDMLEAQQDLEGSPNDIVGIYHSHPDHPSRPSVFDRDHAWPGWSYLIGSVVAGRVASVQSWELEPSEPRFDEESIEVEET